MKDSDFWRIFLIQVGLTALSCLALFLLSPGQIIAFLAGSGLGALNFWLLTKLWKGILDKKPVASSLLIIVTKYAILGGLLFVFIREWKLQAIPLIAGLSTLIASIFLVVLQKQVLGDRSL